MPNSFQQGLADIGAADRIEAIDEGTVISGFLNRQQAIVEAASAGAERDDGGEQIAGTAGTPTTLAAIKLGIDDYDPTLVNGHVLSLDTIQDLVKQFLTMTSDERLAITGMEKGREDLIVAGSLMVLEVMDRWGYQEMMVSDWGLLEGIAIDAVNSEM